MIANNCVHFRAELDEEFCVKWGTLLPCDDCPDYKKSQNKEVGNYDGSEDN